MKKLPNTLIKEHAKQQHCPTCNRYVKYNQQYRNYVCAKCVVKATDKAGDAIAFYHITTSGNGMQGKYTSSGNLYRSPFCFIKGIKCKAEETRAYGIIIMPFIPRIRKSKVASLTVPEAG